MRSRRFVVGPGLPVGDSSRQPARARRVDGRRARPRRSRSSVRRATSPSQMHGPRSKSAPQPCGPSCGNRRRRRRPAPRRRRGGARWSAAPRRCAIELAPRGRRTSTERGARRSRRSGDRASRACRSGRASRADSSRREDAVRRSRRREMGARQRAACATRRGGARRAGDGDALRRPRSRRPPRGHRAPARRHRSSARVSRRCAFEARRAGAPQRARHHHERSRHRRRGAGRALRSIPFSTMRRSRCATRGHDLTVTSSSRASQRHATQHAPSGPRRVGSRCRKPSVSLRRSFRSRGARCSRCARASRSVGT